MEGAFDELDLCFQIFFFFRCNVSERQELRQLFLIGAWWGEATR